VSRASWARRLALAGVVLFTLAQLVPVQRTNPPVGTPLDAPQSIERVLRRSCFDCHSNETRWPWYARVAPSSWLVTGHVMKGRGDVNFSEWPVFDREKIANNFHDIAKQVERGKMPLWSYLLLHPEARLSPEEKKQVVDWAREQESAAGGLESEF